MRPAILPPHAPGLRIGLFGGTFDPPHEAHLSVALMAIRRLGLDFVWWLVTPGNPLKDTSALAPLAERLAAARRLARHPGIIVTSFEADLGLRYTHETVRYLRARCPGVRFVWLMGADNLASFHRWRQWRHIAGSLPIAVVDRAGPSLSATAGRAATALARFRVPESAARTLPGRRPPAWVYLHGLKSPLSSTALRTRQESLRIRQGSQPRRLDTGR
ncbi:nicotinate-nucleotide adenylyltransferase [Xanthobacteraceae bacterium Astr-EGSB]|uniref:nicotinate-nucleotide adenylyltransferase n=1 Tax=Astrobacterium formosum TaxID=3069710 RepID=UPI0027B526BC|nr:nicotinate-nucleotide adenylyltransferase [Xanthobacteraceae bacterium Astr-EGSB]